MPKDRLDRIPPHNLEAEQSVVGSLLIDNDAMIKMGDLLTPEDFYKDAHGMIFQAICELSNKREPIDLLSLTNRLEEKGQLEAIGGRTYLAMLANIVPTAANVVNYAQIVQRKSALRRLIKTAGEMVALGFNEEEDPTFLLDQSEQKLFAISQRYLKQNFVPIQDVLAQAFERIDELHKNRGQLRGITTGYTDLDATLSGLQRSDLVILAARPSMGKTSLALDIARHAALAGTHVGIFSLEMSRDQIIDRILCAEAGVDLWKVRTGNLSEREGNNDFERIGMAMARLSEAPLFIDDSATANVMEIRTKARRLQMEHGLGLLVIDYLQLMEGTRRDQDNRVQEIAEITRALKAVARELNIPVIALSQLSRAVEMRSPPIPKLADLRESGSIEQDSDVVMFIYREEYYKRDTQRRGVADVFIAKHRNGPTGKVELYFDDARVTFKNLDKQAAAHSVPPPPAEDISQDEIDNIVMTP